MRKRPIPEYSVLFSTCRFIMFFQKNLKRAIAREVSQICPYFDKITLPIGQDSGKQKLYEFLSRKFKILASTGSIDQSSEGTHLHILDGDFNVDSDIQIKLDALYKNANRSFRVAAVLYNPYLQWLYRITNALGLTKANDTQNFVTQTVLENFCKISGFEVVRISRFYFFPFHLLGIGTFINRLLRITPIVNRLAIASIAYLRPVKPESEEKSISIIVAARNEEGNIENILRSIPSFTKDIEVIFVEGNSTDHTWAKINECIQMPEFAERFSMMAFQQPGKGKADAVRVGFHHATKDIVTILDADLTMPAEDLPRYYEAYQSGLADFVNGSRLVYPMEKDAMRFINHVGNIFFAKLLSVILDIQISDSLCGTKMFSREDYYRIRQWNTDFGDFDPFGDYEMIFPASVLKLGIVDIPITYRARTYGDTNISRFRDSIKLFKMCLIGFLRIKF